MKPFFVLSPLKMMNRLSSQSHIYDVALFTNVDINTRTKLKQLTNDLITADDETRNQILEKISDIVTSDCADNIDNPLFCEFTGLLIQFLLDYFLQIKTTHESTFYHYLNFLSQLPITTESPYYAYINKIAQENPDTEKDFMQSFDQLQLLYLLTDNGDYQNAEELLTQLEPVIDKKQMSFWVLIQLAQIAMFRHHNKPAELLKTYLNLIIEVYNRDSSDSSINFIIRWLISTSWHKQNIIKKTLLLRIYDYISDQKSLNTAMVLYELFTMEDRLVPSAEKIDYQRLLIKYPASVLNVQQLHSLYFFAGYYNCSVLSNFKDSIQNYQYSNYFLHKSWDSLLSLSRFLREKLDPEHYFSAMPFWEIRIRELSNQASLQNSAYVESLQTNFYKIEELYEKVEELSLTDSLTGLRNRRYLEGNLLQMIVLAARHNVPVCLSMIDIDFFKLVNDNYGHLAGDYVLKEIAAIISSEFRKSDVIIRYGGDEFIVILFDLDPQQSYSLMEELRQKIEASSFMFHNQMITVTISIGIACDFHKGIQPTNLTKCISFADQACYLAKTGGRNRIEMYRADDGSIENNC